MRIERMQTESPKNSLWQASRNLNLLLLLGTVLILFGVLEVTIRIYYKMPPFYPVKPVSWISEDEKELLWISRKLSKRIENDVSRQPFYKEGIDRIVLLGDSMFYEAKTRDGRIFERKIQRRTNRNSPTTKIQMINLAVYGYTTYQELLMLRLRGMDYRPDYVVMALCLNDLYERYLHAPIGENHLARIHPDAFLSQFDTRSFFGRIFSKSFAAHFLIYKLNSARSKYAFEKRFDFQLAWKAYGWDYYHQTLKEIKEFLDQRGIPLLVVAFPIQEQFHAQESDLDYVLYPQKRLREIASSLNVDLIDMYEPIKQSGGAELYKDYLHLNPEGNDVLVNVLTKYFKRVTNQI